MRILRTTLLGLLALGLLGVQGMTSAALITGVTVEDFSTELGGRPAGDTINQSGLSGAGAFGVGTHNQSVTDMWLTGGTAGGEPTTGDGTITYNLGANYDLSGAWVWNYNERADGLSGARAVEIFVSPDTVGNLVSLSSVEFAIAGGTSTDPGSALALVASNVRLVRFEITRAWGNFNNVGLSEVQFDGVVAIPEPTSLLLMGLGMIGLIGFGRRRK